MSRKKDFGFALIEAMMVLFIFVLLSGVMFTILATGRNAWEIGEVRIQLQQELRKGLDAIVEELRQASPDTITNVPADGRWYTTVTFRIPVDVVGGSIVWGNSIQFLLGGLNGRQLLRRSGGTDSVLANNLIYLGVRRQTATPVIVEISLQGDKTTAKGNRVVSNLNFQVDLRN